MTIEQVSELYPRVITSRLEYMNDVRMGVWAEGKELDSYYKTIVGR